jgi:hypothetical protein
VDGCVTMVLAWCCGQAVYFISLLAATAPCSVVMFVSFVRIGGFSLCWYVKWGTGYRTVHLNMKYILFCIYSLVVMNCYPFDSSQLLYVSLPIPPHVSTVRSYCWHTCVWYGQESDSVSRSGKEWTNHWRCTFAIWYGDKLYLNILYKIFITEQLLIRELFGYIWHI